MRDLAVASSERARLESELLALFARGAVPVAAGSSGISDEEFNALALRVFRHQFEGSRLLRLFWERRGATPATVRHWMEIPGMPTAAFKEAPLCAFPPAEAVAVFETSGTTAGGRPGRHYLRTLALYEASLLPTFTEFVIPERRPIRMLNLGPNGAVAPHSSLGHMLSLMVRRWGAPGSAHFQSAGGPDLDGFRAALRRAEQEAEPVCLLGTAFGFIHWLDGFPGERFRLAPGSRLMDTGGTKGRTRELPVTELYAAYERSFEIPPDHLLNEYGMSELSSQYYDVALRERSGNCGLRIADCGLGTDGSEIPNPQSAIRNPQLNHPRPKRGPPWLRTLAVDPESLRPLPEGQVGLLLHFDLANLDSVVAVQTDDLGRQSPEGLQLLGRATGAEARGCSLAAEELMAAVARDHP